jgi:hypothetical protein
LALGRQLITQPARLELKIDGVAAFEGLQQDGPPKSQCLGVPPGCTQGLGGPLLVALGNGGETQAIELVRKFSKDGHGLVRICLC